VTFDKRTIRDADVRGKRVLVRVDFNVPLEGGNVADDTRIRAALPTLQGLVKGGAAIGLVSHLGRPKGRDAKLSLAPVAKRLSELIGKQVRLLDESVGADVEKAVRAMNPGDLVMLENVRFHPEEEKNDPAFARQLARIDEDADLQGRATAVARPPVRAAKNQSARVAGPPWPSSRRAITLFPTRHSTQPTPERLCEIRRALRAT